MFFLYLICTSSSLCFGLPRSFKGLVARRQSPVVCWRYVRQFMDLSRSYFSDIFSIKFSVCLGARGTKPKVMTDQSYSIQQHFTHLLYILTSFWVLGHTGKLVEIYNIHLHISPRSGKTNFFVIFQTD